MTRPTTKVRDEKMLRWYERGIPPKKIATMVTPRVTVWVVYMAVRRIRAIVKDPAEKVLAS